MWRWVDYALAAAILGLLALLAARIDQVAERSNVGQAIVHDGDTLTVGGQRMRLRGIDAPEYRQVCTGAGGTYPCGRRARAALAAMAAGKAVTCKGWENDKYGRLLVTCAAGNTQINSEMVRQGWAVAYGNYSAEEAEARQARRGLWKGEFQRPRDWRLDHERDRADEPEEDAVASAWAWLRQLLLP